MKYKNFILRAVSLVVVVGALFQYNSVAYGRQQIVDENKQKVAEAEAYNESIMALENEDDGSASTYMDGVYEGTGIGFGGDITLSVTIAEGKISQVEIVSADAEDPAYFDMAKVLTDSIVEAQSSEVDTVSGATYSSNGIRDVAADALSKAVAQ